MVSKRRSAVLVSVVVNVHAKEAKLFNQFHRWIEDWMHVLYPDTAKNQQKILDAHPQIVQLQGDVDGSYVDLCYDAQRFGYLLGYLAGCRVMGATPDEMLSKAKGWTIQELGHTRWELEMAAKKE